jgi:toxin-antitoxin system PIN domain toxin
VSASLFDSNVWLALALPKHPHREQAQNYLAGLSKDSMALFCRATEQSWLRLITTPALHRAYDFATITNHNAIKMLNQWHTDPRVGHIEREPPGTHQLWLKIADRNTASPKLWMDAYLAAFAISGQLCFVTADKDFRQFQAAGLDLHLLKSEI